MNTAVMLIAHGTVEHIDELPGFLRNIRRGHEAPPELLVEVTRRYQAIGGQSPLNAISRRLATALEHELQLPVRYAARLWEPSAHAVATALVAGGVNRLLVLPLAQFSAPLYVKHVQDACKDVPLEILGVDDWGNEDALTDAYAECVRTTLKSLPQDTATTLLISAHSLPKMLIDQGDPYEREFRESAATIAKKVGVSAEILFQSQGMGTGPGGRPMEWLGPDVKATLDRLAASGTRHVTFAPVGFLADHVEILFDLDIEAKAWCDERNMGYARTPSLNDSAPLVAVLASLARSALGSVRPAAS